jgi:hypothetical protein
VSPFSPLFRFSQVELPWPLGPPDGRYLLRPPDLPDAPAAHVIVFATLGAPERRRLAARRRQREAPAQPGPTPVSTGRATIIEVGQPLADLPHARAWLQGAGEPELAAAFGVLNRALHAFRVVTADPYLHPVIRRQALVARIGFGAGEQVADGRWTDARELAYAEGRRRRARVLHPQARLAAVLGARDHGLVTEELTLRARLDLDHGREREGALQLLVALDAALAELPGEPAAAALASRLSELRAQREAVVAAAQSALGNQLAEVDREAVRFTLGRLEAALRARSAHTG